MYTKSEVLTFIEENDVKFVRLAFCDLFGVQKNISILASELANAFETGVAFDASVIPGFETLCHSDLFLHPDPSTLSLLPWRPSRGRVVRFFCDICQQDGTPFALDARRLLGGVMEQMWQKGIQCSVGAECEFYLFQLDEQGRKTDIPSDEAGYLDIAPLDQGENVRREICLCLEEMGLLPESSHHEKGPGQHEIDFKHSSPLTSADNVITFRSVVQTLAARNGLYATFHPKPLAGKGGTGFHIKLIPERIGETESNHACVMAFLAGILGRIGEISAFLNPIPDSYRRLGGFYAPKYLTWSTGNYGQLIRLSTDRTGRDYLTLRSPDSMTSPYLVYLLLLQAGLEGIDGAFAAPKPVNSSLEDGADYPSLPDHLEQALKLAESSAFVARALPPEVLKAYWNRFSRFTHEK